MDRVFLQILNMSITSSYVILLVIGVRLFLIKAPKIFSYLLWPVVLFRLICPISFASMFSLLPMSVEAIPPDIVYAQSPQIHSGVAVIDQGINNILPTPVAGASVNPMQIWLSLATWIWFFGATILFFYSIFTGIKLYRKLKTATHVSGNIYEPISGE